MQLLELNDDLLLHLAVSDYQMMVPLKKTCKKLHSLLQKVGLFVTTAAVITKVLTTLTVYNGSGFCQEQNIYIVNDSTPGLFVKFFFVITTNGQMLLSSTNIITGMFSVYTTSIGDILFPWKEYDVYLHGLGSLLRFTEEHMHKSKAHVLDTLQTRMQLSFVACKDVPSWVA